MRLFSIPDVLLDSIEESSTTTIGNDIRELSEVDNEVEEHEGEEEVQVLPPGEQEEKGDEEVEGETEDEEGEGESEEEGEEEEELEDKLTHPFSRPSLKAIEEQFPGFFKKFPQLRDMYFREAKYSKLFPTVEDAEEASENNTAFQTMRDSIFNGNGNKLFSAIKDVDEKKLESFATTVLATLAQVHMPAFWRAANPFMEDVTRRMFEKGEKEKNENLQNAARVLSDYFFGTVDIAEGKRTSVVKVDQTSDNKVNEEREKFEREKDTGFRGGIETDIKGQLVKLVDSVDKKGRSRLDSDGVFSPFIKKTIIESVINDMGNMLASDKDHIHFMDSLWDRSRKNGRTDADKSRIISAYLERAKSLIPSLRSKYVSEALGQKVRVSSGVKKKIDVVNDRRDGGSLGRSSREGRRDFNPKTINYGKTSDEDILNDRITYK